MTKRMTALLLCALVLAGCAAPASGEPDDGTLRIVTTLFPYYDFARAVTGSDKGVTLLLAPGREAHSFEPTPLDAVAVSRADVFIYNGGESEEWVEDLLDAVGENIGTIVRMMDYVDPRDEEFVEGMQGAEERHHDHGDEDHAHGEDSDEIEYDEHIWTSPANAAVLCEALCDALCAAAPDNAEAYRRNGAAYARELRSLDARFHALRGDAKRDLLIFADRMPLLYFCKEYGLRYRAAFHGCSSDVEPSLATLGYLIDKTRDEGVPVVYTVDLDSARIAEAVSESTGASIERLWSLQTVSRADFDAGETYLTMMERNLTALKKGLG
ncbi:MAG: zinc ABC transporter substrate-binding protein [Oscillospiraceae bacterium]|nr:zinc ABC transporter substrate-binding protein [Oscillospiraceae bacterium]